MSRLDPLDGEHESTCSKTVPSILSSGRDSECSMQHIELGCASSKLDFQPEIFCTLPGWLAAT